MPGKVRVKILAGRNLPVMDRSSDTTDAYVEIKFGSTTCKTDVYRKSLHPQWNSDWFRFEVDDADLQDEPLQIRIMDHDTYSANDAIGKVNISLNPLLLPTLDGSLQPNQSAKGSVFSGWLPVYDTMHGIRGEINIIVKVDLFSDVNKFRQSSCGVQFFHSPIIPYGYHAQVIHGFVEELIVNDDPEYQWIDKIRTPRASNEARQVVFLKLSNQVQRKIGLKAIDLGANAVIGYNQCFDLEGDVGVVARGIGTAVTLIKIQEPIPQAPPPEKNALIEEQTLKYLEFLTLSAAKRGNDSKFDFDPFSPDPIGDGDIVHMILGIEMNETLSRSPSIILNKKMRKDQDSNYEMIEEEMDVITPSGQLENLKSLLEQEDLRDEQIATNKKSKMNRLKATSKNILNKRINSIKSIRLQSNDQDDKSFHHTQSDIALCKHAPSLRTSAAEIGANIIRKVKPPKGSNAHTSSDGVGMATLLVRSMMAAPSLDSIAENTDSIKSSPHTPRPVARLGTSSSGSMASLRSNKSHHSHKHVENKLNICVGDSLVDLKASDSNLSSNVSNSSQSILDSSSEEDNQSEIADGEVVMIDADTISMVVKSVLAKEEAQTGETEWIQPSNDDAPDSDNENPECDTFLRRHSSFDMSIKTGATRVMNPKEKKKRMETCLIEKDDSDLKMIFETGMEDVDAQNWIQPGSTADEDETSERAPNSMFHDFKETISERLHQLHLHHHNHSKSEIKDKHGLLEAAMENMLLEQASLMGAQTSKGPCETTKFEDKRNSSIESFKKLLAAPFRRRSNDSGEFKPKKEKFGLFDSAMKTMLIETAHIIEGVGIHPKSFDENDKITAAAIERLNEIKHANHQFETKIEKKNVDINQSSEIKPTATVDETQPKKSPEQYSNFRENLNLSHVLTNENVITNINESHSSVAGKDEQSNEKPTFVLSHCASNANIIINAKTDESNQPIVMKNVVPKTALSPNTCHDRVPSTDDNKTNNNNNNNNSKRSPNALRKTNHVNLNCSKSNNSINKTNKTKMLAPDPHSSHRSTDDKLANINGTKTESIGTKINSSPTKVSASTSSYNNTTSNSTTITSNLTSSKDGKDGKETICRRSSDSDLSVTPKVINRKRSSLNVELRTTNGIFRSAATPNLKTPLNLENLDMLEYPFLTMSKYPVGFILQLGSTVCARSVKLLERVPNPNEPETRDFWWTELRMEIRSHARALGCNVILGYVEITTISDDVCVLSVIGTAAIINPQFTMIEVSKTQTQTPKENDLPRGMRNLNFCPPKLCDSDRNDDNEVLSIPSGCSLCHIPHNKIGLPVSGKMKKCAICKKSKVPEVLLTTIEIPDNLQIIGRGCLIHAQACRYKKDLKSESNAKEISDALPFLEYDLQRLLVNKLKAKGMNAVFGMKITISIGEKMLALIGTGTGVYLPALPPPNIPKIVQGNSWTNVDKINELNRSLEEAVNRNREIYQLKVYGETDSVGNPLKSDVSDDSEDDTKDADVPARNKDICILEIDDVEDLEIISLILEPGAPEGFHVVNTQTLPGVNDLEIVRNLQMFTQVWRAKFPTNQKVGAFPKHFIRLLQTIYFKLRSMIPCAIMDLKFRLDLPEGDEFQILVNGIALGLLEPSKMRFKRKMQSGGKQLTDDELIFNLEEEHITDFANEQTCTQQAASIRERYGIDITPLTYIPSGIIEKYLGNLNFFFIRESTSIRENGGISGFVHSFITELLAVVRAHITALGGNAMVSFYMSELTLVDNPHKNQGQTLISVGGDVVFVSYFSVNDHA